MEPQVAIPLQDLTQTYHKIHPASCYIRSPQAFIVRDFVYKNKSYQNLRFISSNPNAEFGKYVSYKPKFVQKQST